LRYDLRENPGAVTDALGAITETILAFAGACAREGVDGFFYSVEAARTDVHTAEEYLRFGEPYDRRILEAVRPACRLIVLHGHGEHLMLDRLAALPADAWNWDDRGAGPSLDEGKAQDAIARTDGTGLILGAGSVLVSHTSDLTLVELIRSIGGQPKVGFLKPQ